ncbi:GLUC protein, partial [Atractosteus spatula]|nr:GLUC protein [Atractosteus spatula]
MKGIHSLAALLLLIVVQGSWQVPLQDTEDNSRLLTEDSSIDEPRELTNVKRHSQGTFTNDYSKYLDTRRAQDFVQWLMSTKRSGNNFFFSKNEKISRLKAMGYKTHPISKSNRVHDHKPNPYKFHILWTLLLSSRGITRRHADGTYTSDVSSYLQDQAAKKFVTWLKQGQDRRDFSEESSETEEMYRRHADGSFTSDVNNVLDSIAAKEFIIWVMNSKPSEER